MVLAYLGKNPELEIPDLTLDRIRRIVKTDSTGTLLGDVKRINHRLMRGSHVIQFSTKEDCSFPEIGRELQTGMPVIAWTKEVKDDLRPSH